MPLWFKVNAYLFNNHISDEIENQCLIKSYKLSIGEAVETGEVLAVISDPFGRQKSEVFSEAGGIIFGISSIPLVNKGDAMIYIATFTNLVAPLT